MNSAQKIIKYLAIAFAFLLIFNIMSLIMSTALFISNIFNNSDKQEIIDMKKLEVNNNVKSLTIDVATSNVTIKVANNFSINTDNEYIKLNQNDNIVNIKEKSHNLINNEGSNLIISIPKDYVLDTINVATGAGTIEIEKLSTKTLNLDLGAGKVDINNLEVFTSTKINGGAGEVNINNSSLNNLDLDMGIGKFNLNAKILGNSKIDQGVGEANLNLIGTQDDYQINLNKGLGTSIINGNEVKDKTTVGIGINKIDIDGGIGSIRINFS